MTKTTPIQKPSRVPREKLGAKTTGATQADTCELLVAELRARRERLRDLLAMIQQEAGRDHAARAHFRPRRKCSATRHTTAA
jgi:hypothetical protein